MLFGLPISFGSLLVVESARGEGVQALGLVSLAVVMVLLVTLLLGRPDERAGRAAAATFGVSVGLATVSLRLTSFVLADADDTRQVDRQRTKPPFVVLRTFKPRKFGPPRFYRRPG